MSTKLIVGFLALPAIFLGLLLSADYAVVDVREGVPGGMRIIVPVPLALARVALSFAPPEARYVQLPEIAEYLPYAEGVVEQLRGARDELLVSVEERGKTVRIRKVDDMLEVRVVDGDERIDVNVPLDAVLDVVRAYDGRGFDTRDLLRAVGRADGSLVHVRGRAREEVKVWIW